MEKHKVEIIKITQSNKDYNRRYVRFYGVGLPKEAKLLKREKKKKRFIEFYGDSITCGHAVEDTTGKDSGIRDFENNYYSYAAITARYFNTRYSCIAMSGIGLMAGFRTELMPDIYDRVNPFEKNNKWSLRAPDLI